MKITVRPKAYSYIRMSTERQLSGDSLRRQLQDTRDYAAKNNLDLDESLRDIGVSAYTGENVENGALGRFLQLVKSNQIAQGSYLIIESLDRLSRKNVLEALPPFLAILQAGIIIVTLADKQVYSAQSIGDNPYQLMGSLVVMIRANEESATKSKRIKEAMSKMREAALRGEGRYNINLPTWIDVTKGPNGTVTYSLNEHAETVRLIYELAAEGVGQMEICRILHRREIPTFSKKAKGWHQSAVSHILSYPAVIGTYAKKDNLRGRYVVVGPEQRGFFPAAVDEDLYLRAQKAKRAPAHKGRKGNDFSNLFVGMITCRTCGGPMSLYYGRTHEYKYLRCYNRMRTFKRYGEQKKQFQCTNGVGISYPALEIAILDHVPEFKLHEVFRSQSGAVDLNAIAKNLIAIETDLQNLEAKNSSLIEELSATPKNLRHLFHQQLQRNSELQEQLEKQKDTYEAQRINALAADEASNDIERQVREERDSWPALAGEELYRSRSRIHTAFKHFIDGMSFDPDTKELLVYIANGFRAYKFKEGKLVATFDAVTMGHASDKPGAMRPEHFATDVRLQRDDEKSLLPESVNDLTAKMQVVTSLFDAKANRNIPNPVNPHLNDPDVIALKAKRQAAKEAAQREKASTNNAD